MDLATASTILAACTMNEIWQAAGQSRMDETERSHMSEIPVSYEGDTARRCGVPPISDQARRAIDTLRTNHARLMSPLTKNPNLLKVRQTLEQTRAQRPVSRRSSVSNEWDRPVSDGRLSSLQSVLVVEHRGVRDPDDRALW
jgi:hypothetical protein